MDPLKKGLKAYQKIQNPPPAPEPALEIQAPRTPRKQSTPTKTIPEVLPKGEKNLRKVAKFLILLGKDEASKVVRHLSPGEIQELSKEIASIKNLEGSEAGKILEDFGYISSRLPGSYHGGPEVAQAILDQAFGPQKAKALLHRALPDSAPKHFDFLQDLELGALITLLKGETEMVLSLVLPHLPKAYGAKILMALSPALQNRLILRMAKMAPISTEVVNQVEASLKEKIRQAGTFVTDEIDGHARLAEILRHMNLSQETSLLKSLDTSAPQLAHTLREKLFTQETLMHLMDDSLEDLLRSFDERQIALLLVGAIPTLQAKIRVNISSRRMVLIQEEIELMNPPDQGEVQSTLKDFLELCRSRVRDGSLVLLDETEEYL